MEMQIAAIIALIMSIVLHEMAHGYAANALGDPTARLQGRLSPNPIVHIDPLGSVVIPALLMLSSSGILFGWAKPVPYNPYNLTNQKWGEALVAIAGPAINVFLALVFALLIRFAAPLGLNETFVSLASYIVYMNILLACFNLIPFPPLDGSKILPPLLPFSLQMAYQRFVRAMEGYGFLVTIIFIFLFINIFWTPFAQVIGTIFEFFTGTRLLM
jgi:Zn-dependent protease